MTTVVLRLLAKHAGKSFNIPIATEEGISDIIDKLQNKATGIDKISTKLVKVSRDVIKEPLTKAINSSINEKKFPKLMKYGKISPIYKNPADGSRLYKTDYRPVTVLTVFFQKSKKDISLTR